MDYQVDLESFRGPLDLLLYLVKHNEVDICDIPIARITDQFLGYLNVIQAIDVEWAGEFLVMAATLTEIKSRMVLPRAEEMCDQQRPRLGSDRLHQGRRVNRQMFRIDIDGHWHKAMVLDDPNHVGNRDRGH